MPLHSVVKLVLTLKNETQRFWHWSQAMLIKVNLGFSESILFGVSRDLVHKNELLKRAIKPRSVFCIGKLLRWRGIKNQTKYNERRKKYNRASFGCTQTLRS
ncbi:MAG: hypothetical protein JWM28_489 [Chitinophagaceae bacterium]|nr:hypothetical protein [Chitinophagaceae bacterium]